MGKTVIRVIALLAILLLLTLCVPTSTPLVLAEDSPRPTLTVPEA